MMGYAQVGVPLPRTAAQQYAATARLAVPRADAQPGDLVFWAYRPADPTTIHHVAIYVGAGRIVEAAHEGVPVHEVPMWNDGGLLAVATRPRALLTVAST
jgi:cell wall-associated NlpC family hydrolase